MEEKEVRTAPETEEEETALLDAQEEGPAEDAEPEEEQPRRYFGRFTPGVWHGGILGLAFGYILIGVLGLLDSKFSFGIRSILENPAFKYGLMIVLMYGLGKLGGHLEKSRETEQK